MPKKSKKRGLFRRSDSSYSVREDSKTESNFDDGQQILIKGYLKKKSPKGVKGMKPWQKRFFVLTTSDFGVPQMVYYKDSKMKEVRGKIPLENITNVSLRDKNRLDVNMRQASRTFSLRAPTEEEAQAWARQIAIVALMIRETLESTADKDDRQYETCPDGTIEDQKEIEQNQKKLRRQLLRMGYPPYRIMKAVKEHHTLEECVQFLDEQRLSSAAKPVGPSPERRLGALRAKLIRKGYSRGYINMALKRHNTLKGALIYLTNVMSKRQEVYESLRGDAGDKSLTRIKSIRALTRQQNLLIFRKECLFRKICYVWDDRLNRMETTLTRLSKALEQCENPNLCTCFECIPSKRRTKSLTESDPNYGMLSDLRALDDDDEHKHSDSEQKNEFEQKSDNSSASEASDAESVASEPKNYNMPPERYDSGPDPYQSESESEMEAKVDAVSVDSGRRQSLSSTTARNMEAKYAESEDSSSGGRGGV